VVAQGTLTPACSNCGSATDVPLGPLPASGTYTVLVQQTAGGAGAPVSILLSNSVGGALTAGTAQQVSLNMGQPVQDTFTGTAGQYLGLSVSVSTASFSGTITVLSPAGAVVAQGTLTPACSNCGSATDVPLGPLPASGTYTVLVQQTAGGAYSATVNLGH
jgi:large repetitive protein